MEMTDQMKEYTGRRGLAKGSLTRLVKFADAMTDRTATTDISTRLELLEKSFNEFNICEAQLAKFEVPSELEEYESKYLSVKAKLKERLRIPIQQEEAGTMEKLISKILREQNDFLTILSTSFTTSLNQTISQTSDEPHAFARLPKLNVPMFSGEYKDFPSFRDLYVASVHSKLSLNDVEKFQYLKGYLRGEAADLVKHIAVSEANYQSAWEKLCKRYDKKRHVLNDFIKAFLNQPTVSYGSAAALRKLYNTSDEVTRGIAALGKEAEGKDPWLIFLLLNKTDQETKQAWAYRTVGKDFPTFDEFLKFISERCDALETCEPIKSTATKLTSVKAHQVQFSNEQCAYCRETHRTHTCEAFVKLSPEERRKQVAILKLCFNCLSANHMANQCYSKRSCSTCRRRHRTLLHDGVQSNSATLKCDGETEEPATEPQASCTSSALNTTVKANVSGVGMALLPTAVVMAKDSYGQYIKCNLLMDSGSQISFISEKCVNRLGISRKAGRVQIEGIATSNVSTTGKTSFTICSRFDISKSLSVKAYILPKITCIKRNEEVNYNEIESSNLQLADPNLKQQKEVDILLGADYFFLILGKGQIILKNVMAQETLFGYVISRKPNIESDDEGKLLPYKVFHVRLSSTETLEKLLRKFWEQEEILQDVPRSVEEQLAEEHFVSTYKKINGRFVVQLPIRTDSAPLGQSYKTALQRLHSTERKMSRNIEFGTMYREFMRQYEELGHMRKLSSDEIATHIGEAFYLPHHGVLREDSVTTKLRVVFDGSATTSTGTSLNDKLMIGPSIQDTLWAILLRFRTFKVAICGDIEKMYRQILVDRKHTPLQRILWRENPAGPVVQYELLTVTYGTASAPFLSIRVLFQIASDCEDQFPEVTKVIRRDFYVDDVLTGTNDEQHAITLKRDLSHVLAEAGLVLRKWRSNITSLSDGGDESQIIEEGEPSKLLGLYWNSKQDMFSFKVKEVIDHVRTKRNILSLASQIFDPLGWLSPFTIRMKIFLQSLWLKGISWDEPLPSELHQFWCQIQNQFYHLNNIRVPRFICNFLAETQIHGFSDASELAYSAAIYIRTRVNGRISVNLLTAKTKVAPIQQVSLPRLELCGAHLLAKLVKKVLDTYHLETVPIRLWIDSTVVLSWLSTHPHKWKTYVANRVSAIHQLLPESNWLHVKGKENPADLATRGTGADRLVNSDLWWKGPNWLSESEQHWPLKPNLSETLEEKRNIEVQLMHTTANLVNKHPYEELYGRINNWSKLLRTIAYVLRFLHNCAKKTKVKGNIGLAEINNAELELLKFVQQMELSSDIKSLMAGNEIQSNSRLISLAPFIDSQGMLRVGGRLENASCSYDTKHPLILPKHHTITRMILIYLHKKFMHPGPSLLLALSRHKYWIQGGRELCRSVCHKCITCFRYSALKSKQQMGNLPKTRTTPSRPFSIVGVDYAGPILLSSKKGRGAKLIKGFLVIFVCFSTKALHLEVASELTTDAFLATLDRFVARRGAPTEVHSDNGTNFVGAKRKLHEYYQLLSSQSCKDQIINFALANSIKWNFIPPVSPHFGGIWERAVQSVKTHLIKVTGTSHLTFEEMITVMAQIEGILNSRPLCAIKNEDTCNIDALTPSHFLTLGPITALPHANYDEIKMSRLNRWERVQKIVQQFWNHYFLNYLNTLQQRPKWQQKQKNIEINDIVLIHESKSPPCTWPLGRVIEVHTGKDGLARVATIQTKHSVWKRPIIKMFKLPLDDEN